MRSLNLYPMMAALVLSISVSCASQLYLNTPLVERVLRFSDHDLYWSTCEVYKGFWGSLTSKDNCKTYQTTRYPTSTYKQLGQSGFKCMVVKNQ